MAGCARQARETLPSGFNEKKFIEKCNASFSDSTGSALVMESGTGRVILLIGENSAKRPYTLGSVFKPVTLSAALAERAIDSRHEEFCDGRARIGGSMLACWRGDGHGLLTPTSALANSCNIYFGRVGAKVGAPGIIKFARQFGFGELSGLGLDDESEGTLPGSVATEQTPSLAIGELDTLTATPLQVLVYMGAIATRGTVFNLHSRKSSPDVRRRLPFKDALDVVVLGMHQSVLYGTSAEVSKVTPDAAGKTGTAKQPGEWRTHSWFGGFYPVENPEIVLVIFTRRGQGRNEAARAAAGILNEYIKLR